MIFRFKTIKITNFKYKMHSNTIILIQTFKIHKIKYIEFYYHETNFVYLVLHMNQ